MVLRLLLVLLVLLGLHAGYQFASPFIVNAMLEGKMKDMVKHRGLRGENDLRRDLMAYIREKNIPIHEGEIFIEVSNARVAMAAAYETDVKVWFYQRHYDFQAATAPDLKMQLARGAAAR
jgi:hypothetical protein